MTSAGYSGTPLMKTLGAKPGMAALYEAIEPLWSFAEWGRRDVVERPPSRADAASRGPYERFDVAGMHRMMPRIRYHGDAIYAEGELLPDSTIRSYRIVQMKGSRHRLRSAYNTR
jgi:hypothetical protein